MSNGSGDFLGFFYVLLFFTFLIVLFFIFAVLIEAAVYRKLHWGRFQKTLLYSFIANFFSTAFIFLLGERLGADIIGRDLEQQPLSILMNYIIQVIIEIVVLFIFTRLERKRLVSHVVLANLISVAILYLIVVTINLVFF